MIKKAKELRELSLLGKTDNFIPQNPPEFVEVQADETYVPEQGKKNKKIQVKTALIHNGRKRRYPKGKEEQLILSNKKVYVGVEPSLEFVERVSADMERNYRVSEAKVSFMIGDGAESHHTFKNYFPEVIFQLDHYHLNKAIKRGCCGDKKLEELIFLLIREDRMEDLRMVIEGMSVEYKKQRQETLESLSSIKDPKKRIQMRMNQMEILRKKEKAFQEMKSYILHNLEAVNAYKSLEGKVPPANIRRGSGGAERNVAVCVGYRMKKQGKAWKERGCGNLCQIIESIKIW